MANVNTRIKIVSDSTCDLSDELLSMYDITILPVHVLKGGISATRVAASGMVRII